MALNALVNIGELVGFAISISDAIKASQQVSESTYVEIGAGLGPDVGGGVPAIALWNAAGERIGQYMQPDKKIDAGTSTNDIVIMQDQGHTGQPEYMLLTTVNTDAICMTYVSVSGNGVNWNWMGDIGFTCGADWYPSTAKFGSDNYQPRCAWIDSDHSNGLRYIGYSMHMPDFNSDAALTDEYNDNLDLLCNSKARFMRWGEFRTNPGYNTIPPMFNPPLEYNLDGSDKDFDAIFKPGRVSDDKKRDHIPRATNSSIPANAIAPGHVILSDYKAHNKMATEVCESDTSRGPSFVSTQEGVYCDMSTKTTYPICSDTVTSGCFDTETKQLVAKSKRRRAGEMEVRQVTKRYETFDHWKPE